MKIGRPRLPGKLSAARSRAKERARQAGPFPHRGRATSKAVAVLIVTGSCAGFVALGVAAARPVSQPVAEASAAGGGEEMSESSLAGGYAIRFVRAWYTATSGDAAAVRAMLADQGTQLQLPAKAPEAPSGFDVASTDRLSAGQWAVTVAVTGGAAGQGEWYEVLVATSGGAAVVTQLPSRVGPPATVELDGGTRWEPLPASDDRAVTAVGFVRSWLTDSGDIDRWSSSDLTVNQIIGQPCGAVELVRAQTPRVNGPATQSPEPSPASDDTASPADTGDASAAGSGGASAAGAEPGGGDSEQTVLVTASCLAGEDDSSGRQLTYELTLTRAGDQWVVDDVNNQKKEEEE